MITNSTQLDLLGAALAKAQASVKGAKRDAANPFFKSTYADLASTWEACREALTTNGLSVVQLPGEAKDGTVALTTMLLHSSGQWIAETATAPLAKQDAQGVGSAITYLRRYALAAVASVAPEDDDGNAASQQPKRAYPKPKSNVQTQPLDEKPLVLQQPMPNIVALWPYKSTGDKGVPIRDLPVESLRAKLKWLDDKIERGLRLAEQEIASGAVPAPSIKMVEEVKALREILAQELDIKSLPESA